jgi:Cu+-exporting ATPase
VIRKIKEGLFWAFFYNVVCIPVAAGALVHWGIHLNPMFGAAAMSLSSVTVVANALRLKGFKPTVAVKSGETLETGAVQLRSLGLTKKKTEAITAENESADKNENNITGGLTMEKVLKVEGMTCKNCQKHVHNALAKMEGVTGVEVSLEAKTATVQASRDIPVAEFEKAITDAGYELVK